MGVVFLAIVAKLLEDPALAFRDWVADFLFKQYSLPGRGLLLIGIGGWILGALTIALLQKSGLVSVSAPPIQVTAIAEQEGATAVKMTPQEQAAADLDEVLQEVAVGNTASLPGILQRLRFIFDRLGRDEDAGWCQAELNGYNEDETPHYRYADVTIEWRSVGGVGSMNIMTGRDAGKPPDRLVSLPVAVPVEEIVGMRGTGRRTPTGRTQPGVMGAWNEVAEISPEAVQGVLRRIRDEGYRRATEANKTIEAA